MPAENTTSQTLLTALESLDVVTGITAEQEWCQVPVTLLQPSSQRVLVKTVDYTLTSAHSGSIITNAGATGAVVIALPAATVGLRYRGHVRAAFALRFDPNGSEIIANATAGSADGTAGQYTGSSTVGASIELVCLTAGRWEVQSVKGTWVLA